MTTAPRSLRHGLAELREAQADLAPKFGEWLKSISSGALTPGSGNDRATDADEVVRGGDQRK